MILTECDVLYQIEMRVKTERIVGTLCKISKPSSLHKAMTHLDVWNSGEYISNPYATISQALFDNMTPDLFRIFIEYVHHWMPAWTPDEIRIIIDTSTKYGYLVTIHKDRISFRRDPTYEDLRLRY